MDSEGVPATKLSEEAKESNVVIGRENDSSVVESNENLMREKMTWNTDETLTADNGGCSSTSEEEEGKKTLLHADELVEKGSKAIEAGDYAEAVDCLSQVVEIRVANYGELAPECVSAYYKYGCALLYKAQEEADPLGNIIKNSKSSVDLEAKTSITAGSCESSIVIGDNNDMHYDTIACKDEEMEKVNNDKDQADGIDGSEGEDLVEEDEDEDESDLDLAWKTLDIARAIIEKSSTDTIEKVNIFSALGEVSLEREDIDTSLIDYKKALSILEHLVESDSRRIAELNFRICLVLEVGSRVEDAIPYCQKAISVCRARLQRLTDEVNAFTCLDTKAGTQSGSSKEGPNRTSLNVSVLEKQEEIETLRELSTELGKKLEDLQQSLQNPNSSLTEFMKMLVSKSKERTKPFDQDSKEAFSDLATSSRISTIKGTSNSPTVSTGASNNVTHLGVVGRGIKRALVQPVNVEPIPKKVSIDLSIKEPGTNASEAQEGK